MGVGNGTSQIVRRGVRRRIVLLKEGRTFDFDFFLDEMHDVGFLLAWCLDGASVLVAVLALTLDMGIGL